MVNLSRVLNEYYGEKPTQWSERDYEQQDFEYALDQLEFTPAALVIVGKDKHNAVAQTCHDWYEQNTTGQTKVLWADADTKISYMIAFENASEAALFKLNFCC